MSDILKERRERRDEVLAALREIIIALETRQLLANPSEIGLEGDEDKRTHNLVIQTRRRRP